MRPSTRDRSLVCISTIAAIVRRPFFGGSDGGPGSQADLPCTGTPEFTLTNGVVGLCPHGARPGDDVVILYAGLVPYILRKTSSSQKYLLVGECYVEGPMYGEGVESADVSERTQIFEII